MEIENDEGAPWDVRGEEGSRDPCGARALTDLGMIYAGEGRNEAAEAAYGRALEECKRLGDMHQAATVMINFGKLALSMDEPLRAHALASTAATFARRLDHGPICADALLLMGSIARSAGRWREAERHLDRTLEMSRDGKIPLAEAEAWREIGEMRAERGRDREAIEAFRQARRCYLVLEAEGEAGRLEDRIREHRTRFRETESVVTDEGETRRDGRSPPGR
ncbi:MAG: tetratricopeptide repeat protein [Gemmatimonadota bacterium]|nr:tetratricopeptide repeat protein [Gemmatimonadota bacterium]